MASDGALVEKVWGKDMLRVDLDTINKFRIQELKSDNLIEPKPDNDAWHQLFFLVRFEPELVAFGRLHPLKVELNSVPHDILGIASIVATRKGQGYGALLMQEIRKYAIEQGKAAVGFCSPSVTGFYQKCNFTILPKGINRFEFKFGDGSNYPIHHPESDALYIDDKDGFFKALLTSPQSKIIAFRQPW